MVATKEHHNKLNGMTTMSFTAKKIGFFGNVKEIQTLEVTCKSDDEKTKVTTLENIDRLAMMVNKYEHPRHKAGDSLP